MLRPLLLSALALAQAPAVISVDQEPRHRIVYSDAVLRVLEVNIPSGDTTLEHRHDHDLITVNVENGRTRTRNSGEDWGTPRLRMPGEATIAEYSGKPGAHVVQNIDTIAYRLVGVENPRAGSWTQGAAVTAPGLKVLSESRAFRVYELRLDAATPQTRHVHDVPVVATLLTGGATIAVDTATARPLTTRGQWAVLPAGQPHVVARAAQGDGQLLEIEVR